MASKRQSIAPLVTNFETAIQENRKKGYDKDLNGNVGSHKPVYNPERVRRLSELFPPPEKNTAPRVSGELFDSDGALRVRLRQSAFDARQRGSDKKASKAAWLEDDGWLAKKKYDYVDESVTGTTEGETITTEGAYDVLHDTSFGSLPKRSSHNRRVMFGRVPSVIETHSDDANEDSADISEVAAEALAEEEAQPQKKPLLEKQEEEEAEPQQPVLRDALRASFAALNDTVETLPIEDTQIEEEKKKRRSIRKKAKLRVLAEEAKQPPAAPRPVSPPPTSILSEEEQAEDPEIQALLERIQRLQGDYQAVKDREAEDMKKLERNKKMHMARFWEKGRSKRHVLYDSLDLDQNAMEQRDKQYAKLQTEIEQLRKENNQLRRRCTDYSSAMRNLKKEKSELERNQSMTLSYTKELQDYHESQEIKHKRASAVIPQIQNKVEACLEEADDREAWTEMERKILGYYKSYELKVIEMIEYRCDDSDLVEEVVRLHLGLDPIPEGMTYILPDMS